MKVAVVGGGPAGYVAAIRAAQLGAKVTLIEEGELGGECTNWACIPSKTLLRAVEVYKEAAEYLQGLPKIDWKAVQGRRWAVVKRLREGIEKLLSMNEVEVVKARAQPAPGRAVKAGGKVIEAEALILATGSVPAPLPNLPFGGKVLDTKSALLLEEPPNSVLIVGGGAAGVELATLFAKVGSKVVLVEVMDRLLPALDADIGMTVERELRAMGVEVYTSSTVLSVDDRGRAVSARLKTAKGEIALEADYVVAAAGRRPNPGPFADLVKTDERGHVVVDGQMRASAGWVYAAGDVAGPPYFAHKAYAQAKIAAEAALGRKAYYEPLAVPAVVFSDPEVASVGMTEDEARRAGYDAKSARVPLSISGMGLITGGAGFVKLVYDGNSGRILGVHAVGRRVSEIAGEAALLVEFGATVEDLALVMHPHPTISELLVEAAELAVGKPTHIAKRGP
ncbi:dihydrolipoamide dehydrogenase [Pyrobaculum oguniense TE7]|uniref:Dihydrolipoyl dehydrogenase n=1 Tax=Pyrobaculum oguniense (strain DSM 13380 / JCM 10595 / TE7) TaxID=698757 RepID=H6Q8L4_PYROT|nr:dihydrolipoamide dehydrogenase [Pyrobaculum oguniense TE7]